MNSKGKGSGLMLVIILVVAIDFLDTSPELKAQKIEEYYKAQNGFESKDQYGVRVRVNAMMQIIRAGAVREAIDLINPDRLSIEAQERMKDLGQRLG